jgi:hypothetical protein
MMLQHFIIHGCSSVVGTRKQSSNIQTCMHEHEVCLQMYTLLSANYSLPPLSDMLMILIPTEFPLRAWKMRFDKLRQTSRHSTLGWMKMNMEFALISKVSSLPSNGHDWGHAVTWLGEALCYKLEGRFHLQGGRVRWVRIQQEQQVKAKCFGINIVLLFLI